MPKVQGSTVKETEENKVVSQSKPATNNGREYQAIDNRWVSWDTIKKVMAVVLIGLLIFGIVIPPFYSSSAQNYQPDTCLGGECPALPPPPSYLEPHHHQIAFTAKPISESPITTFPPYLPKMMLGGLMSGGKGNHCQIPEQKLPKFSECEEVIDYVELQLATRYPEEYQMRSLDDLERGDYLSWGDLKEIFPEAGIEQVHLGMDPKKQMDYAKALTYVERNVLQADSFFEASEKQIVHMIKNTNKIATQYFSNHRELLDKPGGLRNYLSIVLDGKMQYQGRIHSWDGYKLILEDHDGTAADFTNLNQIKKLVKGRDVSLGFADIYDRLTSEQIVTLRKIGFLPCLPCDIEGNLLELAVHIKDLANQVKNRTVNAIAAASYVHQGIVKTHAFADGNGRVARIWMNAMLQLGGYRAVGLPVENEYVDAVNLDDQVPGTFAAYLEKVIHWNEQQKELKV